MIRYMYAYLRYLICRGEARDYINIYVQIMKISREEKFREGENIVINMPHTQIVLNSLGVYPPPISVPIDSGSFSCSSRTVTR